MSNLINRNPHPTKKGPGRRHKQGQKHGRKPPALTGTWVGQHTNAQRAQERKLQRELGSARQMRKAKQLARRNAAWGAR